MKDVALRYKNAGVPVAGVGVQSHLKNFDVHLIKVSMVKTSIQTNR